jgi:hypothetical protein
MKNGKTPTSSMTQYGSSTESWKSLYREQKDCVDLKTQLDPQQKADLLASAYLAGIHTCRKKGCRSKGCWHSMKQEKYFHRLKLKVKEQVMRWRKYMESHFGVLVLGYVILIFALSLLLYLIPSFLVMFLQG